MPQHGLDGPRENGAQVGRRRTGFRLDGDLVAVADQDAAGARQDEQIFAAAAGLEDRPDVVGAAEPGWNFAAATVDVGGSIGRAVPFRQGGQGELRIKLKSAEPIGVSPAALPAGERLHQASLTTSRAAMLSSSARTSAAMLARSAS